MPKDKIIENVEFGLDSRYQPKSERIIDGRVLMKVRLDRMKNVSQDKVIQAKLIQLKLRMEE